MKKLLIILLFVSCKTVLVKQYKITALGKNYYTDKITYAKDSVYFTEYNRNGKIRFSKGFKASEVKITENN